MDDMELLLKEAEKTIEIAARKFYSIDGYDYEDLLQIGRIKVWEIISEKKVTKDDFGSFRSYITTSLYNLFGVVLRKSKAAKRINLRESASLDAEVGEGDDRTAYDFIPDKGGEVSIETLETIKIAALKTKERKAIQGVIWCLVELLNLKIENVPKKINYRTFVKFGLARYLWIFFNNSPFLAIRFAYSKFEPKDMKKRPNGYWKGKRGKNKAIAELREILEKSGYKPEDYPLIATHDFISDHGLRTPLDQMFSGSPFNFLDAVFPGKYMPWTMSTTPMTCFSDVKNVIFATRWLMEDILGFDIPNLDVYEIWRLGIGRSVGKKDFEDKGLRGLLNRFGNSPEKIIRFVYPGKFQDWDLGDNKKWSSPKSLELAAKATKWVIEEYAGLTPDSPEIGYRFFVENGLRGMITSKKLGLNSSPKAAIRNAYPERYVS
ncbi:MAG: hypothetical protein PHG66_06710 [Candidatus Colwellbacteria bacterium]|nr:hypothetical protein [Candidatus Colwellbacteria bacterium]